MRKPLIVATALMSLAGANALAAEQSRCLAVPREMVAVLEDGFEEAARGKWRLLNAQAVRSKSFKKMFFISAEIDGPIMERKGDIATWASNSLQPYKGIVLAVSALATEFSVYPDGRKTKAEVSMWEDGAVQSKDCVRRLNASK